MRRPTTAGIALNHSSCDAGDGLSRVNILRQHIELRLSNAHLLMVHAVLRLCMRPGNWMQAWATEAGFHVGYGSGARARVSDEDVLAASGPHTADVGHSTAGEEGALWSPEMRARAREAFAGCRQSSTSTSGIVCTSTRNVGRFLY